VTTVAPVAPEGFEAAARDALAEVTPPGSVGDLLLAEHPADEVTDLEFGSTLPGYIGWRWTVSMAQLPGEPPAVLELELLPREGALLAPAWVPWAERLAEYRRTHPDEAAAVDEELEELEDDELDADEDVLDDDVLDDEADDELDGVDFEAPADLEEDDEAADDELAEDDPAADVDDDLDEEDDVEAATDSEWAGTEPVEGTRQH
jgi:hypothetical protein